MIILGDKYTFTKVEYSRVKKYFKHIIHISYKNASTEENINRISNALTSNHKDLIVLNTQASLSSELITYLTKLEILGIRYITIENFLENYLQKCLISEEVSINTSFLEDIHAYTPFQYFQKRLIDYSASLFLLLPTLLAIIYSKYRIKKESPGNLFFIQSRIGLKKNEFLCIKLRSMHINAEKDGAKFADGDHDPRTYPWGKIIRYNKIDELLQLWNVFKGEMHFVGPRPERKIWTDEFEKSIPYYGQRHLVAPGITGLAQIKYQYGSGKLDAKEKLMYDLYYIKNWSLKLELTIIWKTLLFVTTKKREDLSNF
ncbi:MAG: Bacterial sugar transferase [uncultured Sulfurovum sp.]|uniref:Bacterial sugar transferase n=1 Tax=uncultured Sulfurovum sp. TaxID=269237 RepID=A0A6S6UB34_9BACT|nr:MAG: Bacterial sugar transferase [uncultured Sulfurovum sp.]